MQTGSVGCVTDIHARTLAHGFQSLQYLDGAFTVRFGSPYLVCVNSRLKVGAVRATLTRMHGGIHILCGVFGLVFFGHDSLLFVSGDCDSMQVSRNFNLLQ
jgi:hypothetical protein